MTWQWALHLLAGSLSLASPGWLPLSRSPTRMCSHIDCVLEPGCISGDRAGLAGQPRIDPWRRAPTTIYAAQFSALGFRL